MGAVEDLELKLAQVAGYKRMLKSGKVISVKAYRNKIIADQARAALQAGAGSTGKDAPSGKSTDTPGGKGAGTSARVGSPEMAGLRPKGADSAKLKDLIASGKSYSETFEKGGNPSSTNVLKPKEKREPYHGPAAKKVADGEGSAASKSQGERGHAAVHARANAAKGDPVERAKQAAREQEARIAAQKDAAQREIDARAKPAPKAYLMAGDSQSRLALESKMSELMDNTPADADDMQAGIDIMRNLLSDKPDIEDAQGFVMQIRENAPDDKDLNDMADAIQDFLMQMNLSRHSATEALILKMSRVL